MSIIKPECTANAIGMLQSRHSKFLGCIGDIRYYCVDGITWSHDPTRLEVARAEDSNESEYIRKVISNLHRSLGVNQ